MKDLLLRAHVVVRNSNMKISPRRLADCQKLHQKACRTCSTITFPHLANQIIDLWRRHRRWRRHLVNSLLLAQHVILKVRYRNQVAQGVRKSLKAQSHYALPLC